MRPCPVCGQEVTVPVTHCPTCNSDLALSASLNDDILGPRPVSAAAPTPKVAPESPGRRIWRAALTSFFWGLAGAAVFAVAGGISFHLMFGNPGEYSQLLGGLDFGSLVGFMLGSISGAVKSLEPGIAMGAVIGAALGTFESLHHHFTEWFLIAPPDIKTHMIAIMGLGAGAVTGACCVMLREFHDNR